MKRIALITTLGVLAAGGLGLGVGWHAGENDSNDERQPTSVESGPSEPTPDDVGKRGGEMPPDMHNEEPEPEAAVESERTPLPYLEDLYQQCSDGDMVACDDLFYESPVGSEEEQFADTCGDRQAPGAMCALEDGEDLDQEIFREAIQSEFQSLTVEQCTDLEWVGLDAAVNMMRTEWDKLSEVEETVPFVDDIAREVLAEACPGLG